MSRISSFSQFMTWVLYFTSLIFIWEVAQLERDMREFNRKMVWNIDATRERYLSDVELAYKTGCHAGVDYPPEFRKPKTEFNQQSPAIWCHEKYKDKEEYFLDQLPSLGRSEQ